MTGGKGGKIPVLKPAEGITTRGSRAANLPKAESPRTPRNMETQDKKASDFQRVLEKLDGIESRLESKIDDAIKGQEMSSD